MQALCLTLKMWWTPPTAWRQLLCWLGLSLCVHAAAQPQVTTPLEALQWQARQWAANQSAWRGRQVSVAPLDARIPVPACQQMLQFEQPFPNQPSAVRVRCALPSWQLFITLTDGVPAPTENPRVASSQTQKVLVAHELLKRGTPLSPGMFSVVDRPSAGMEAQLIQDPQLVTHMELVRDLLPNTPLRTYDVKNAVMVKRGQDVLVTASSGGGFLITVKAEALQDGGFGETIRLKNMESGRSLSAEVTGPGTAKLK